MAGPNGTAGPGSIVDLPEATALELLRTGQAAVAPDERVKPVETATAEPVAEEAVVTKPKKLGRGRKGKGK